jgi:hypothetical protein
MMVNYAMLSRQLSVSLSHVLAETWRPLLSGLLMYPVVHLVSQAWRPAFGPLSAAIELLCLGMLGLALHVALIWAAWRSSGRPSGAETTLAAELRKRLLAARLNAGRGQS